MGEFARADRMREAHVVQRADGPCCCEESALARRMNASPQALQLKSLAGRINGEPVQSAPGVKLSRLDEGLPPELKAGIEGLSGLSMDGVNVHYNSEQPGLLQAHATTQGRDIHIAPGQERHLPHEAWHVVQQMQGRVRPTLQLKNGTALNDESWLEREADVMGARAASAQAPVQAVTQRKAVSTSAVLQLAAPGGIEHAMNSCFVAALINTFAVVRPLRNLLNTNANPIVSAQVSLLQDLLRRAVNTIATQNRVTQDWIVLIMGSLRENGVLGSAVDTADFNQVMARVVGVLSHGQANAGQADAMPVTTGEVVWGGDQTLQDVVAAQVNHQQQTANNFNLTPNSVHVTRNVGNNQVAPQSFNIYPANGATITYRLRSIIERDAGYVGGHFVSNVDRGDGGQEWWHSDDLNPGGVANVANLGTSGLQARGQSYFYERSDAVLAGGDDGARMAVVGGAQRLQQIYDRDFAEYIAEEEEFEFDEESFKSFDPKKYDPKKYDKDLEKSSEESNESVKSAIKAFKLPAIKASPEMAKEVQRQLKLQLDSLNRLSVKDWAFQVMLNRMKSPDQLIEGYSTGAGARLKARVDKILKDNGALAKVLLGEIQDRMFGLRDFFNPVTEKNSRELLVRIYDKAEQSKFAEEPWAHFEALGGIADLANLSALSIKGGIGRQYGEGDNAWFRRVHKEGVLLFEHGKENTHAVLHNPDQVAGGQMEIFHSEKETQLLDGAKANFLKACEAFLKAKARAEGLFASSSDKSGAENAKQARDSSAEVYSSLISRYMGDSAVNSLLGQSWIEDISSTSRVEQLLEAALKVPLEQWETTRMNVAMDVHPDSGTKGTSRKMKDSTAKKKAEKLQKLLTKTCGRKKGGGRKRKPKDEKLKKVKKSLRQPTLHELAFRGRKPTAPDLRKARSMRDPQLRWSLRAQLFFDYRRYVKAQEHPDPISEKLVRLTFQKRRTDVDRYLLYQDLVEARRKRQREAEREREELAQQGMVVSDDEAEGSGTEM